MNESKQSPPGPGPNNPQGGTVKKVSVRKAKSTSPKAGRDPVQPNSRGQQGQG